MRAGRLAAGVMRDYGPAFGQLIMLLEDRYAMINHQRTVAIEDATAEGHGWSRMVANCDGALDALMWTQNLAAHLAAEVAARPEL